ncbi:MAG: hypothetical protein RLZZ237_9, partial [Pseudomonadota bacterium]
MVLRATVDVPPRPPRLALVLAWLAAVWRGSRAWSVLCAILTICLLLCIWIYTAIRLDDEAQQALDRARIENHDVATILGAHLDDALVAAPELPPDLSFFLRPYRDISSKARDRIEIINHRGELLAAMENGVPTMAPKSQAVHAMPLLLEQRLVARHGLLVRVSQDQALVLAALAGVRRRHLTQAGLLSLALLALGGAILLAARRRLQWQRRQAEGEQITLSLQLAQEKSRADQLAAHDALTGVASRRR